MNPTPAAIAAIRAHVSDWAPDDAAIAAALNSETVANPAARADVPSPIYESVLMARLTDPANGSLAKLLGWVNFGLLKADIAVQNRVGLLQWCQTLPLLGLITNAAAGEGGVNESAALTAYLSGTVPDPDWPATVPWGTAALGRPVDEDDVAKARPQ